MNINPTKTAEAVQHALEHGFAAITFNKDSRAGNFARNFHGEGCMYISLQRRNLYICGEGGYIMSIPIDSAQDAVNYINDHFNALALSQWTGFARNVQRQVAVAT